MQTQPVGERGSHVEQHSLLVPGATFVDHQLNQLLSGPSNRTKYTYDALTGALMNTSERLYPQGAMRRVTGRNAFVTASPYVGATFYLFEVDPTGYVRPTASSIARDPAPYHVSQAFGFAGNPAKQLITDRGELVCLTPEDCENPELGGFQLEGRIATLGDGLYFGPMEVDNAGELHTIVSRLDPWITTNPDCYNGCSLQRVDVTSGTVEASVEFKLKLRTSLLLVRADTQGGIVVACNQEDFPGHRVVLLPEGL